MATFANDLFTEAVNNTPLTSHTSDSGHNWLFWAGNATSPGVYTTAGGVVASGATAPQIFYVNVAAPTADVIVPFTLRYAANTVASVGACARLGAAGTTGYMGVFQNATKKWTLYRLSGVTATLLAESAVQTMTVNNDYACELSVSGSGATVTLDFTVAGVSMVTYADTNAARVTTAGFIGVWFNTAAAAAGQYIGALSGTDVAAPPVEAIASAVADGRIFKHSGALWAASNTGSIVETGTYSGFTPNQVRLVQDGTNTPLTGFDWTAITTATGGAYAHTFTNVPQGVGTGWYSVQLRDSAVPATILSTGKRGVGMHIGHYGQSQSSNQFDNYPVVGSALTPTGMSRAHGGQAGAGTVWNWAALDPAKNSAIIAADILLNALTGGNIPMAFINMGYPGTGLVAGGSAQWLPTSGSLYQYGKSLLAGLEGSVDVMVDIRGESDANNGGVAQAAYYAGLGTLYAQTRTDCGNANLPIVLVMLGSVTSYWTDANGEAIKKAMVQKSLDANIYRVESYDAPLHTDNLHRNTTGCERVARRWARAVASILGLATGYRSPRISAFEQISATVYDATIAHGIGTDFTPTTAIPGLRLTDSVTASVLTTTTIARQAADKIRVTLSTAPANMPRVATAYGANVTANIADNSSLALPLEYNDGHTATALAVTAAAAWTDGAETFAMACAVEALATTAVAAWTEGSEIFATVGTADAATITAAAAWAEGLEVFAVVGAAGSGAVTGAAAWNEGAEVFAISTNVQSLYASAPSGDGYRPRINSIRPPAIQG